MFSSRWRLFSFLLICVVIFSLSVNGIKHSKKHKKTSSFFKSTPHLHHKKKHYIEKNHKTISHHRKSQKQIDVTGEARNNVPKPHKIFEVKYPPPSNMWKINTELSQKQQQIEPSIAKEFIHNEGEGEFSSSEATRMSSTADAVKGTTPMFTGSKDLTLTTETMNRSPASASTTSFTTNKMETTPIARWSGTSSVKESPHQMSYSSVPNKNLVTDRDDTAQFMRVPHEEGDMKTTRVEDKTTFKQFQDNKVEKQTSPFAHSDNSQMSYGEDIRTTTALSSFAPNKDNIKFEGRIPDKDTQQKQNIFQTEPQRNAITSKKTPSITPTATKSSQGTKKSKKSDKDIVHYPKPVFTELKSLLQPEKTSETSRGDTPQGVSAKISTQMKSEEESPFDEGNPLETFSSVRSEQPFFLDSSSDFEKFSDGNTLKNSNMLQETTAAKPLNVEREQHSFTNRSMFFPTDTIRQQRPQSPTSKSQEPSKKIALSVPVGKQNIYDTNSPESSALKETQTLSNINNEQTQSQNNDITTKIYPSSSEETDIRANKNNVPANGNTEYDGEKKGEESGYESDLYDGDEIESVVDETSPTGAPTLSSRNSQQKQQQQTGPSKSDMSHQKVVDFVTKQNNKIAGIIQQSGMGAISDLSPSQPNDFSEKLVSRIFDQNNKTMKLAGKKLFDSFPTDPKQNIASISSERKDTYKEKPYSTSYTERNQAEYSGQNFHGPLSSSLTASNNPSKVQYTLSNIPITTSGVNSNSMFFNGMSDEEQSMPMDELTFRGDITLKNKNDGSSYMVGTQELGKLPQRSFGPNNQQFGKYTENQMGIATNVLSHPQQQRESILPHLSSVGVTEHVSPHGPSIAFDSALPFLVSRSLQNINTDIDADLKSKVKTKTKASAKASGSASSSANSKANAWSNGKSSSSMSQKMAGMQDRKKMQDRVQALRHHTYKGSRNSYGWGQGQGFGYGKTSYGRGGGHAWAGDNWQHQGPHPYSYPIPNNGQHQTPSGAAQPQQPPPKTASGTPQAASQPQPGPVPDAAEAAASPQYIQRKPAKALPPISKVKQNKMSGNKKLPASNFDDTIASSTSFKKIGKEKEKKYAEQATGSGYGNGYGNKQSWGQGGGFAWAGKAPPQGAPNPGDFLQKPAGIPDIPDKPGGSTGKGSYSNSGGTEAHGPEQLPSSTEQQADVSSGRYQPPATGATSEQGQASAQEVSSAQGAPPAQVVSSTQGAEPVHDYYIHPTILASNVKQIQDNKKKLKEKFKNAEEKFKNKVGKTIERVKQKVKTYQNVDNTWKSHRYDPNDRK